jgi:hypothetical protein
MGQQMDPGRALKMWEGMRPIDADEFARRALNLVAENRGTIIVPAWWRLICWLNGASPRLFEHSVALALKRILEQMVNAGPTPSRRSASEPRHARAGS